MKNTSNLNCKISCTIIAVILLFGMPFNMVYAQNTKNLSDYLKNLPFQMPEMTIPVFPDRSVNIREFGAVGDGQFLNTEVFAKAIEACTKQGGGKVIVPPGIWLTGPIVLQSNINLHLEKGALILLSRNHKDFPIIHVPSSKNFMVTTPIFGANLENVAVTGEGIIDGSGDTWRQVKKAKTTEAQWKDLVASGGVISSDGSMYWPTREAMEGEEYLKKLRSLNKPLTETDYEPARDFLRPNLVQFQKCKNVLLDGPTFQNSPKFVLYPSQCENVVIRNIKVLNEWWAQNGDGIDISACKNVLIYNCMVNAGDDGICMKSSRGQATDTVPNLQNIVISDCVVYHAHGGFVIGSNTDGGMRNISVNNCNFISTDVGLRFKSSRGRGGVVENIYVSNIFMKGIATQAILFDTYYESTSETNSRQFEVNEKTPRFRKFYISNIFCSGAAQAVKITGLPEMPIQDIELKDAVIEADKGFTSLEAKNIRLTNVNIIPASGVVYELKNSADFVLRNLACPKNTELFMMLDGKSTSNIQLIGTDVTWAKKAIEFGNDVDHSALIKR